ncbi:hypothetical protein OPIT5_08140 [Opitutaceae bacterium TAV5]|nr:hypothetical protein OPIT5_08140 [Opitutaceae bacterium TAV5]
MRVLVACEYSGAVRDAFRALGHDAMSCDLLPSDAPGPHYQGDVRDLLDYPWDVMIAHPPCTHLSVSGARHFVAKRLDGRQQRAVSFFMMLARAPIPRIAIENPVCIMSTLWRPADQVIQPWHHGHPETKATCLWLKNLPKLVPSAEVEPDYMRKPDGTYYLDKKGKRYSRIHFMSGRMKDSERWKERSRTYAGIAAAMAAQWGGVVQANT